MVKNLNKLLKGRPINQENLNAHRKRIIEVVRSYRVRELRKLSDLSQVELAERRNVRQDWVSRIEHGDIERAKLDTLRRYVELVGGELRVDVHVGD